MARRLKPPAPDRQAEIVGYQAAALRARLRVALMALRSRRISDDLAHRLDEASLLADPCVRLDALRVLVPEFRSALRAKAAKAILPDGLEDRDWTGRS